jgi:hypothetical protein
MNTPETLPEAPRLVEHQTFAEWKSVYEDEQTNFFAEDPTHPAHAAWLAWRLADEKSFEASAAFIRRPSNVSHSEKKRLELANQFASDAADAAYYAWERAEADALGTLSKTD